MGGTNTVFFSFFLMMLDDIVAIASTDLSMAQFLASLVAMTTEYNASKYVIFGIYVGIIVLHGFVNSTTVRLNGMFNMLSGKQREKEIKRRRNCSDNMTL